MFRNKDEDQEIDILEKKLWNEKLVFTSDDHNGMFLYMYHLPNQDLYISIEDSNRKIKNTVRLATSGGISTKNFEFIKAASDMYRALAEPIEKLIPKVNELSKKNNINYYICTINNNNEIFNEDELKEYINELYKEHLKKKTDSVFNDFYRIMKYKILTYSTEE